MTIRYTMLAQDDLDRIAYYYTEHVGAERSGRFIHRVVSTLERLLSKNPRVGRLRLELGADVRSFPVLPYVAFYEVRPTHILILRILHGHRNIQAPLASLLLAV